MELRDIFAYHLFLMAMTYAGQADLKTIFKKLIQNIWAVLRQAAKIKEASLELRGERNKE